MTPKIGIELPSAGAGTTTPRHSELDASSSKGEHNASTLSLDRTASTDSNRPLLSTPVDFARQWLHKVPDEPSASEPVLRSSSMIDPMSTTMDRTGSKSKSPTRFRPSISAVKKASKQGLILRRAGSMTGKH